MNDKDITKLASKLTESLATKEDVIQLKGDIKHLKTDINRLEEKIDTVLVFTEAIDETTDDHEKRLRKIESVPVIALEIRTKHKM